MRHSSAPEVRTERLVLRGHRLEDFADSAAMWGDPAVTRFIGGRPMTEEETWVRLQRYVGHWALMGYGFWRIDDHGGRFVGEIGFFEARRALEPGFDGSPEAGWALATAAHGRGYAREALAAVVAWGDAELASLRTCCMIAPEHAASIRLAERFGYREFARTAYHGSPTVLFERMRP